MKHRLSLAAVLLLSPLAALQAAHFYVAPNGNDTDPGTEAEPFATLEKARDGIRESMNRYGGPPAGGVTVYLRGGIYQRTPAFSLSAEDSGTRDAPVVYAAAPGEVPRLVGGVVVQAGLFTKPNEEDTERLKKADAAAKKFGARVHWWRIRTLSLDAIQGLPEDVPGTIPTYGVKWRDPLPTESELFVNGQCMALARWPNNAELFVEALDLSRTEGWGSPHEIWVQGSKGHVWSGVTRNTASASEASTTRSWTPRSMTQAAMASACREAIPRPNDTPAT